VRALIIENRSAPPAQSKPEAANFPTRQYEFSGDRKLYHPPTSYPEPPKDMWYEVPSDKPQPEAKPKAIFPWEQHEKQSKPTRVFAEDSPPPPLPIIPEPEVTTHPPLLPIEDPAPFSPQVNAWDNVASIDRYVRAVLEVQGRTKAPKLPDHIRSPSGRRESLILTDFPSIDDRPSLPVTPAPIRRPTFWGDERDEGGDLPGAEGVPDQAEWVCPSCGFLATSPVAFYRARQPSSLIPASSPQPPAIELGRSSSYDQEPLPPHLKPHRHSSSEGSALSTTSTIIARPITVTVGRKYAPAAHRSITAATDKLRDEVGEAEERALSDLLPAAAEEASPPPSPHKSLLPPAWLTAAIN
jgi:glycogenin glucosyltransferase